LLHKLGIEPKSGIRKGPESKYETSSLDFANLKCRSCSEAIRRELREEPHRLDKRAGGTGAGQREAKAGREVRRHEEVPEALPKDHPGERTLREEEDQAGNPFGEGLAVEEGPVAKLAAAFAAAVEFDEERAPHEEVWGEVAEPRCRAQEGKARLDRDGRGGKPVLP